MNLVFTFDEGYFGPFKVLLHSIYTNNPNEDFHFYFLHYGMKKESLDELENELQWYGYSFHPINVKHFFKDDSTVHINRYYTIEMYLWLFAPFVLPEDVHRALYLDPDIINLNPIRRFYDQPFDEQLFIAMDFEIKNKPIQPINNLRLNMKDAEHYFNTGVVLMNIDKLRKERTPEEIVKAIVDNKTILLLPDQDIFNFLYTGEVKNGDWEYYNLDPRLYQLFKVVMPDTYNKQWVEENAVFIHYAGKHKPWNERGKYRYNLGYYYFFYEDTLKQLNTRRERGIINDTTF